MYVDVLNLYIDPNISSQKIDSENSKIILLFSALITYTV